jgi:parvulin-like peptidyl-prolyl isomerase
MTRNGFRKARLGMLLGGLAVLGVCGVARYYWGPGSARAQAGTAPAAQAATGPSQAAADAQAGTPPAGRPTPAPGAATSSASAGKKPLPDIVATVNGQPITRQGLADDCLMHFGKEVLDAMTNKYLILQECRRRGISITREEIDGEIERMAKRFKIPVDQWMKLLQQERGIRPEQYCSDIVWPSLALRKLAGERLTVTRAEIAEAFEAQYGPAVQARMIAAASLEKARRVQALAAANPDEFGNLAKTHSEDAPSASIKGLIQPIHMHSGCPEIEAAAFALPDGGVSPVIKTSGQYVILKREGLIPARKVRLEDVQARLEEGIRDRKLRLVATETFAELQKPGAVQNVLNDPLRSRQMPGVAALINGQPVTLRQLAEECTDRHGRDVLEGMINRKLIEQACQRAHVTVSPQDLDAEVARAAGRMVKPLPDGSPDVKAWLELVAKRQGVSVELYRRDAVWPSVALEKLAAGKVEVTEEDLKRSFESNYGPRVRCRVIVANDLRRAQRVWEMARSKPTVENFSDLASKYSIEPGSRALGGEVPPIRQYGGQPLLEKEAFSLKPGELSGVIQLEDERYVILFCEGRTKPIEVTPAQVRADIEQDVREKKQRLAMAEYFEHLQDSAAIDNYLAGTSHSPIKPVAGTGQSKDVAPTVYSAPLGK